MMTLRSNPQGVPDDETTRLWAESENREAFLRRLRELGAEKIESIRSVRRLANISLGEAKEVVHFSRTWADRRAADDEFHESVIATCDEIMREDKVEQIAS